MSQEQEKTEAILIDDPQISLTLDEVPSLQFEESLSSIEKKNNSSLAVDYSNLTPAEIAQVKSFAKSIDVRNTKAILNYGAGSQKKLSDFTESTLGEVRTKDLGETGKLISDVIFELKGFNEEEKKKGLLGLFKKTEHKLANLQVKYDKISGSINVIVKQLRDHQEKLMKDTAILDKMYEANMVYFKELTMYVLAGKQQLQNVREGELAQLVAKAKKTGKVEDAQAAQDLESMCLRLEKKISDLELTRTVALQTAPQIRLIQSSDIVMSEKIQTTIVNTIPLWKSQMVIALGIQNAQAAVKAQTAVTDMTNELLRKNADMLHTSTVDIAKASERGIVDIETLQHTNDQLIATFDEVIRIQEEGREKRLEAEKEILRIEQELKQKLLEITSASSQAA